MKDVDRVSLVRSFLNGIEEQRDIAQGKGEPFAIDGESTIDLLRAIVDGAAEHAPDYAAFQDRIAVFQAAPRHTICIAMTGWTTVQPTTSKTPSTP